MTEERAEHNAGAPHLKLKLAIVLQAIGLIVLGYLMRESIIATLGIFMLVFASAVEIRSVARKRRRNDA